MKLKNILSLTMALTMAFTATLGSSASIFADDVDVQETEENQSFTSLFFDELLEQSEQSNIENPDEYGISPMWLSDGHDDLIDSAASLSENDSEIMKHCSAWADDCFPAHNNSKNSYVTTIPALHGLKNYVINLKFLWYFAIYLGKQPNPTSYDDMNTKIKAARSSAIEKLKGTTAYKNKSTNNLQDLIDKSGTLVKYNGAKKMNDSLLKSAKMKKRILGYAAHLAGDIFAHRTMVTSTSGFYLNYFNSNFSTEIKLGKVQFVEVKNYVKNGVTINCNQLYTDNPSFYPKRYDDASANISDMITTKAENFDYYAFIVPCSSSVKLNSLKQYVKNSGLDTSRLTASEWAKYST